MILQAYNSTLKANNWHKSATHIPATNKKQTSNPAYDDWAWAAWVYKHDWHSIWSIKLIIGLVAKQTCVVTAAVYAPGDQACQLSLTQGEINSIPHPKGWEISVCLPNFLHLVQNIVQKIVYSLFLKTTLQNWFPLWKGVLYKVYRGVGRCPQYLRAHLLQLWGYVHGPLGQAHLFARSLYPSHFPL